MHEPIEKRRDAADRFVLRTLGGAFLSVIHPDGTSEILLRPSKPLALLTYLAFSHHRSASRTALLALLWHDEESKKARASLRVALNTLRKQVRIDAVAESADPVRLDLDIETDRMALLVAAKRGDREAVVDLYEGEFFPDYAAPGCAEFERWVDAERVTLRNVFRESAAEIVRTKLAAGQVREAVTVGIRVRDDDPHDEAAWRLLFEALLAARDTLRLASELAQFNEILKTDGGEPSTETQLLLRRVRELIDDRPHALKAELVGRERDFATILRAWQHAREGRGQYLHIAADAGLGKTRLLDVVHERLREIKVRVVHVCANHGARDLAYSLASEIAGALAKQPGAMGVPIGVPSTLVALNPGLSRYFHAEPDPSTSDEALNRRAIALRELIAAVAEDRPFGLLIDDLHWGDPLSLRLLDALFPLLENERVLVLSTARLAHSASHLPAHASTITLEPLGSDDIAELVSSVAPLPDEPWARTLPDALSAATHGSPLLVVETLQLLRERKLLAFSTDGWTLAGDADGLAALLGEGSALSHRVAGLKGVERNVLLLLAVTGVPVTVDQLRDASGVGGLGVPLAALEQRGLVAVHEREWTTAHDEHAAAIMKVASPHEVRSAASAMGRVIADGAGRNVRQQRLAALLLARGEDVEALARLFPRFESAMRLDGDSRSARALARDFLGNATTAGLETKLVRSLPWSVRTRLNSPARAAAIITLTVIPLIVATTVALIARPSPPPVATLLLHRQSADGLTQEFADIPLDAQRLASMAPIDIDLRARATTRIPTSVWRHVSGYVPRPDGRGWAVTRAVPDSGVLDVFDLRLDGTSRRLTWTRLDDLAGSWSPDNRQLVFMTMQGALHGHYKLAVYDTLTRSVRRLTGPHEQVDLGPQWSPDGSRIAFTRTDGPTDQTRICVIDADGSHQRCLPANYGRGSAVRGWADAHQVLVQRWRQSRMALLRIDVDTEEETLVRADANGLEISPDGRYVLCFCSRRGYSPGTRFLFALDAPEELTVVRFVPPVTGDDSESWLTWSPTNRIRPYLASLRVRNGPGQPTFGVPYQLRVEGIDTSGHPIEAGVTRWRSLDTAVATLDSSGLLRPRRVGHVKVEASAGGWRTQTFVITIANSREPVSLLDERWTQKLEPTWVSFGQPQPVIVKSDRFGSAFSTNGDGSFWSGAYTARTYDTRVGLWVEAELSVPLTVPGPSQEQIVTLFAMRDSVRWKTWDHVTGDHPLVQSCRFRYPSISDHPSAGDSLVVYGEGLGERNFSVPRRLRDGQVFRALVQILPDGRCAFAIDGRPLFISLPVYFYADARVMLVGNTQETHNLIGRVQLHSGIAPFVKWNELEHP